MESDPINTKANNNNTKAIAVITGIVAIAGIFWYMQTKQTSNPKTEMQPVKETSQTTQTNLTEGDEEEKGMPEANITETDTGFKPQTLEIKKETKVIWTNKSGDSGNVSSANHPTHLLYPPLNLGDFEDGETMFLIFNTPGTYKYHDHIHPNRFGSIVVTE